MNARRNMAIAALLAAATGAARADDRVNPEPQRRNTIIFVADGLRYSAVNKEDAPTMMKLRAAGVEFTNSHSLYPTFTMPNASAIATGHALGDTGVFGNGPMMDFVGIANSVVSPLENDPVLRDVNAHFPGGNLTNETTLLAAARAAGFHTAAIGKYGPALMQDLTQNAAGVQPATVIVDDATGTANGVALPDYIRAALGQAKIDEKTPPRGANSSTGNFAVPGTTHANIEQQAYYLRVAREVVLPAFIHDPQNKNPFLMVYWSRDPDGSQHGQGDNFNTKTGRADSLGVGINGPTPKAAVKNADSNLAALLDYLDTTDDPQHPGQKLSANTNVFVTSDHGFGTISRHELGDGKVVSDFASGKKWFDTGEVPPQQDTVQGFLPAGFLAIDLAEHFKLPMFDVAPYKKGFAPDRKSGILQFVPIDPNQPPFGEEKLMHPDGGSAILGGKGTATFTINDEGLQSGKLDPEARLVVSAGGGSDLIYLPNAALTDGHASAADMAFVKEIVAFLGTQTYVGGVFVNGDAYGAVPGAIAFDAVGLKGAAQTPVPAIIVSFATFSMDPKNPLYTGVEISDGTLQEGQGMHGTFARFDTFNNMMAIGPDFKNLKDTDPVSNADIAPTLAYLLGLKVGGNGAGTGRVMEEVLVKNGAALHGSERAMLKSEATGDGFNTELRYQVLKDSTGKEYRYFDSAGMAGRVVRGE